MLVWKICGCVPEQITLVRNKCKTLSYRNGLKSVCWYHFSTNLTFKTPLKTHFLFRSGFLSGFLKNPLKNPLLLNKKWHLKKVSKSGICRKIWS